MKKTIPIMLLALSMTASAKEAPIDSLEWAVVDNPNLQRLTPTLMKDYVQLGKPSQHWFIGMQGGASAFIGNPVGCGDIFDRISPTFNAYLGKWITPTIGMRVAFQGLRFKDSNLDRKRYQLGHIDVMYNASDLFRQPSNQLPKWDVTPYLGVGLVHGSDLLCIDEGKVRNYLFALTYGIQTRYHVGQRFYLSGELGCFTTFREFDGNGSHGKLGDSMPSFSLGIGLNLGERRWHHAVDALPYFNQNKYLLSHLDRMEQSNSHLRNQHDIDHKTIEELRKILKIEGLLDKYGYIFDDNGITKNSYKGLLSLRSRLRGMSDSILPGAFQTDSNVLNVPIFFFFQLGKAQLTDDSQLINLDELAKVATSHNLKVNIAGAADSATGSRDINTELSEERTRYITQELVKRGVPLERIKSISLGGIQEYSNPKDNRYCKVSLYLEMETLP